MVTVTPSTASCFSEDGQPAIRLTVTMTDWAMRPPRPQAGLATLIDMRPTTGSPGCGIALLRIEPLWRRTGRTWQTAAWPAGVTPLANYQARIPAGGRGTASPPADAHLHTRLRVCRHGWRAGMSAGEVRPRDGLRGRIPAALEVRLLPQGPGDGYPSLQTVEFGSHPGNVWSSEAPARVPGTCRVSRSTSYCGDHVQKCAHRVRSHSIWAMGGR
jgi:hypothetical protein